MNPVTDLARGIGGGGFLQEIEILHEPRPRAIQGECMRHAGEALPQRAFGRWFVPPHLPLILV